jgi:hypothetical protein
VDAILDEKTGFLVEEKDADAWRRRLECIAQWTPEERAAFVFSARENLDETFSWRHVARRTVDAYQGSSAGMIAPWTSARAHGYKQRYKRIGQRLKTWREQGLGIEWRSGL